jgi:hypothetical protein
MAKTLTDRQRADRGELSGEISPHDQSGALADRCVGQEMIVGACDSVCLAAHKVAERVRLMMGFRSPAGGTPAANDMARDSAMKREPESGSRILEIHRLARLPIQVAAGGTIGQMPCLVFGRSRRQNGCPAKTANK